MFCYIEGLLKIYKYIVNLKILFQDYLGEFAAGMFKVKLDERQQIELILDKLILFYIFKCNYSDL